MRKTFLKTGSDPVYNLNILTSDLNYQMAMLYHARELNLPVRNVELGNEFYSNDENNNLKFPTVIDYADEAISWATSIKSDAGFATNPPLIAAVGANASYGIAATDAGMTVYNNTFTALSPPVRGAINAQQPNYYNEKKIIIGKENSFAKRNVLTDNLVGITISGEYNVAIGRNSFNKDLTDRNTDIFIENNLSKPVDIAYNRIDDFVYGIKILNAGHTSATHPWITIHDNQITQAALTTGTYGIGINVSNTTQQTSQVAIYDNYILEPRIGISMSKVDGAKIYKESTSNKIQFSFNATQGISPVHAGIELNECDNVFVHEN
ncbi:MAG TPA: hypothetical protein PLO59_11360, partial [Bacteroidia bacterium]|nr:hypothetical protein [Bacteroidia bacterium]